MFLQKFSHKLSARKPFNILLTFFICFHRYLIQNESDHGMMALFKTNIEAKLLRNKTLSQTAEDYIVQNFSSYYSYSMFQAMAAEKGYLAAPDSVLLAHPKVTNGHFIVNEFSCFFLPKEEAFELQLAVLFESGFVQKAGKIWQRILEGGFAPFWRSLIGRGKILMSRRQEADGKVEVLEEEDWDYQGLGLSSHIRILFFLQLISWLISCLYFGVEMRGLLISWCPILVWKNPVCLNFHGVYINTYLPA